MAPSSRRLTLRVTGVPLPFDPRTGLPHLIDTVEIAL